jgi:NADPH:quinone reductase-like Zn-dependent oxidoreductase
MVRAHGGLEAVNVEEVPPPEAAAGEVVVEVRALAVNHLDLWVRRGVAGHTYPLPLILGSDAAGVVAATGTGVADLNPGDEVVVAPGVSCGVCAACLGGQDHQCRHYGILGETRNGGAAEQIAVPRANVVAKPTTLSFAEAAAVGIPFLTAWHMLVDRARLRPGETVLVQAGGSGVGSAAIQIASLWGANVLTTVGNQNKAMPAARLGATVVIDRSREDVVKTVKQHTGGRGVDVVVDHIGAATWEASLRCLAWHGRYVTCGATDGAEAKLNLRVLFFKGLSLLGSTMGSKAEYLEALGHVARGQMRPVIDRTLPLNEVREAHRLLEAREVFGRVVLEP